MNRKNYQGFIEKMFVFAKYITNKIDENNNPIVEYLIVNMGWVPSGYTITTAHKLLETRQPYEDFPFRRSEKDIQTIAQLLAEGVNQP